MNKLIIVLQRFWLVVLGTLFMLFIVVFEMVNSTKPAKYIIYAADRRFEANQFNVCGRTIYFKDVRTNNNVCINGEYTLIYETVPEK